MRRVLILLAAAATLLVLAAGPAAADPGNQNTLSFTVSVTDQPADQSVGVDIVATDKTASGQTTQHFKGKWTLVWSSTAKQWLLDKGLINLVK